MFSPSTLQLFRSLLSQVNVPAGAPDFEEQAAIVTLARSELGAAERDLIVAAEPAPAADAQV